MTAPGGLVRGEGEAAAAVLADAFDRARNASGVSRTTLRIAGRPVEIRVAGNRLAREMDRPFAHLAGPCETGDQPALSIDVWDEAETGVACPPMPRGSDDEGGARGGARTWAVNGGTFRASDQGRFLSFNHGSSITLFDRESHRIVACRARAGDLSVNARVKPFAVHLATWLGDLGVHELHAALVGRRGLGVLLAGVSGAGKSTSAMACVVSGLDFLGDDIVAIESQPDGSFAGHSLFGGVCLRSCDLERFAVPAADLADAVETGEKLCLFPGELFPGRVPPRVEVAAVILPRRGGEKSRLEPARRADVLMTLAASTLGTVVPRPGVAAMDAIGRLAERVPGYWLDLGPDVSATPAVIGELLATLANT